MNKNKKKSHVHKYSPPLIIPLGKFLVDRLNQVFRVQYLLQGHLDMGFVVNC